MPRKDAILCDPTNSRMAGQASISQHVCESPYPTATSVTLKTNLTCHHPLLKATPECKVLDGLLKAPPRPSDLLHTRTFPQVPRLIKRPNFITRIQSPRPAATPQSLVHGPLEKDKHAYDAYAQEEARNHISNRDAAHRDRCKVDRLRVVQGLADTVFA